MSCSYPELNRLQEDVAFILAKIKRPRRAVVTAGMPYANGPIHLGHLAGAQLPADIYTRWLALVIGRQNILFVCGTDDHGSTSELIAKKNGIPVRKLIDAIHSEQVATIDKYSIDMDLYGGTSDPDNFSEHSEYCAQFFKKLHNNNMLEKKTSKQWFDPEVQMFLPDRYVSGTCPRCGHHEAHSEECPACGAKYQSHELQNPKSMMSNAVPVMKETTHWYLDMWRVVDQLKEWLDSKKKTWRKNILLEVMNNVCPSIAFPNTYEKIYKSFKAELPQHKSRYAPGKNIVLQFNNLQDLEKGRHHLQEHNIDSKLLNDWAYRSITRDVSWGIPLPVEQDQQMNGKNAVCLAGILDRPHIFHSSGAKKQRGRLPVLPGFLVRPRVQDIPISGAR